MMFFFNAFS